jgi:hypothetical protein
LVLFFKKELLAFFSLTSDGHSGTDVRYAGSANVHAAAGSV